MAGLRGAAQYAGVLRPSAEVSGTRLKVGARRYARQDPCFSAERVLIIVLAQAGPLARPVLDADVFPL